MVFFARSSQHWLSYEIRSPKPAYSTFLMPIGNSNTPSQWNPMVPSAGFPLSGRDVRPSRVCLGGVATDFIFDRHNNNTLQKLREDRSDLIDLTFV